MSRDRGFTLMELLVVIAIISILMSLLVVLFNTIMTRARYADTKAMINTLTMACESYKKDFDVYPTAVGGSKSLHNCLGRERYIVRQKQNQGGGIVGKEDSYVEFSPKWLEGHPPSGYPNPPVNVVDSWDRVVDYFNPKPNAPANIPSFRIVSKGKDGADPIDDIASDIRED